jgi:hypothetical protein
MNLGSGSSSSGSFALSSDQSNLFLMMLDSSAKNISNIINTHAIPELVRYNFNSDLYPTITFKPMNSTKLITTIKTLTDGKIIIPDDDLETYIRDMLDLPDASPAKSREEYALEFTKQQQQKQLNVENTEEINKTGKTKTPIESNSKQKQYTDKISQDKINKMSETIDFQGISPDIHQKLLEIIKKQLIKLNEMASVKDINSLSSIKVNYKGELSKLIDELLKTELHLNENDIKYKAKSNIISNNISEKVKSEFLVKYINDEIIDFDLHTLEIIEKL